MIAELVVSPGARPMLIIRPQDDTERHLLCAVFSGKGRDCIESEGSTISSGKSGYSAVTFTIKDEKK